MHVYFCALDISSVTKRVTKGYEKNHYFIWTYINKNKCNAALIVILWLSVKITRKKSTIQNIYFKIFLMININLKNCRDICQSTYQARDRYVPFSKVLSGAKYG